MTLTIKRGLILLLPVLAMVGYLFVQPGHRPNASDFEVYHRAGTLTVQRETVYDQQGLYQYKYAPVVALGFGLTFSQLAHLPAAALFYAITGLLWAALLVACLYLYGYPWQPAPILVVGALLLFAYGMGLRDELKLGQINAIPAALMVGAAWLCHPADAGAGRQRIAGVLIALALCIKPYVAFWGLLWLFQRRWQALIGVAMGLIVIGFIPVMLYHGPIFALREHWGWLETLTDSSAELLTSQYNVSLLGMLLKNGIAGTMAYVVWGVALVGFIAGLYWTRQADSLFHVALISAAIPVLSPTGWPYWMLMTVPGLLYLVRPALHESRLGWVAIAGLVIFGLAANLQNMSWGHYGLTFAGNTIVLVGLLVFQQDKETPGMQAWDILREP